MPEVFQAPAPCFWNFVCRLRDNWRSRSNGDPMRFAATLTASQRVQIVKRCAAGDKREVIAYEFGISTSHVRRLAKAAGLPPRDHHGKTGLTYDELMAKAKDWIERQ